MANDTKMVLLRLQHPFTLIVCGPTSSGKTVFVRKLLENFKDVTTFTSEKPLNVLWSFGQHQELFKVELPDVNINYYQGMVNVDDITENGVPDVIILDDLMIESISNKDLTALFTRVSHHMNISIIFVIQNLFVQGREALT